jgi:hypothetical protein
MLVRPRGTSRSAVSLRRDRPLAQFDHSVAELIGIPASDPPHPVPAGLSSAPAVIRRSEGLGAKKAPRLARPARLECSIRPVDHVPCRPRGRGRS